MIMWLSYTAFCYARSGPGVHGCSDPSLFVSLQVVDKATDSSGGIRLACSYTSSNSLGAMYSSSRATYNSLLSIRIKITVSPQTSRM